MDAHKHEKHCGAARPRSNLDLCGEAAAPNHSMRHTVGRVLSRCIDLNQVHGHQTAFSRLIDGAPALGHVGHFDYVGHFV